MRGRCYRKMSIDPSLRLPVGIFLSNPVNCVVQVTDQGGREERFYGKLGEVVKEGRPSTT